MKINSDKLYSDISFGVTLAGLGATVYGMYDNVNVPVIAAGLGVGIVSGTVEYIRQGFESRKEKQAKNPKLEELFI